MARYEIWSTTHPQKRLFIKDIFLDTNEVRLQILQSLRKDIDDRRWTLQFPITIGPDLQRFTILRTVYCLEQTENRGEMMIHSKRLDLRLDSYSTRYWNPLSYTDSHWERLGKSALYTYWIRFGSTNEIFFMDHKNVAVLSLPRGPREEPSLISCCGEQDFSFWDNATSRRSPKPKGRSAGCQNDRPLRQLDVHFHPLRPLVAFRTGRTVFLWAFKNCKCTRSSDDPKTDDLQAESQPVLCYKTPSEQASYPEHITFTSNSEQLVIKELNAELPIVMSFPAGVLSALEAKSPRRVDEEKQAKDQQVLRSSVLDLSSFETSNRELVSGAYVETLASGKAMGFTPITSRDNASVLLWRKTGSGFEQEKFEIVKFPAWEGMDTVTSSMKPPEPGQSVVTLVLNKAVQPENGFRKAQTEHFPAVITREVGTLRSLPIDDDATARGKMVLEELDDERQKRQKLTE